MKNYWLEQHEQESWLVYDNIDPIKLTYGGEWDEEMPVIREDYMDLMLDHLVYLRSRDIYVQAKRINWGLINGLHN